MVLSGVKKFMNAIKKAGLTNWEIYTAPGTCWYNSANSGDILLLDESEEMLVNIARRNPAIGNNLYNNANLQINFANLADVHEIRMGCTYEELIKFTTAYGITLTDEQKKKLINIDKANYRIKPSSGYSPELFRELSDEEYKKLSSSEKAEYQKRLAAFNETKTLAPGRAAQITV